jgi:hypothetical protein
MSDAKRKAQDLLAEMLDDAAGVLTASLKGKLVIPRGSTCTADARFVFAAALEFEPRKPAGDTPTAAPPDLKQLAELSERIRQEKQNERRQGN